MKGMYDNAECFTAYATIDAGQFMLGKLLAELPKASGNTITDMIDMATGYSEAKRKEIAGRAVVILEDIIEAKKVIEAPVDADLRDLETIKRLAV